MTDQHILHFTIGPVQGFVAQARRTRDLWAGSFLLSWLAGQAIVIAQDHGAEILFPVVGDRDHPSDPLVAAIRGMHRRTPPDIGTVPNRFKAAVPANFDPTICATRVQEKWHALAQAVWDEFVTDVAARTDGITREIWDRQIKNFWDIAWVKGQEPRKGDDGALVKGREPREGDDGAWLDRRKNWRSYVPPEEGGDHCTLMGAWQEISGCVRYRERDTQEAFWNELRDKKLDRLELRDGERLCSIALVKRLFPRLSKDDLEKTIGWVPGGREREVGRWPSTGAIAAAHWIVKADATDKSACNGYAAFVHDAGLSRLHFGEQKTRIRCLKSLAMNGDGFAELDANFFQEDDVKNARALPLFFENHSDAEIIRPELLKALKKLNSTLEDKAKRDKKPRLGPASSYFAILLMDGDKVGELISELEAREISGALNKFANKVPCIVKQKDGVTIYCGGDDVLAVLPIETAIEAAVELRKAYVEAFEAVDIKGKKATVSAGIVMADHHEPLHQVIEEAHRVLKKVAKDGNDRDSIAVSLLRPSGPAAEWVAHWEDGPAKPPVLLMDTARAQQKAETEKKPAPVSNRFVYRMRERYLAPFRDPDDPKKNPMPDLGIKDGDLRAILRAELGKTREDDGDRDVDAFTPHPSRDETIETILTLTKPRQRKPGEMVVGFEPDGLLLIRFLAEKGLLT